MQAIWITKRGAPNVLEVREGADPEPAAGEVRIQVRAAGLNFAEVMARQGLYPDAPKTPCVVGYEVAGEVDAVGAGVTHVKVGDRVAAMTRFGGHASVVAVPQRQVFPMPDSMSFEEGAALPVNYLTAYHMLFEIKRIRPGEKVLVHMAAGGVGTAALQLCRTIEDVTTYGTCSAKKHDYARGHGCDHPIDYRTEDYAEVIRRDLGERRLDLVLDALGGRDWKKGYGLLRSTGTLIAFGWANMNKGGKRRLLHVVSQLAGLPRYTPIKLMEDNRAIAGVNMGHLWHEGELVRREALALMKLFEEGKIKPHIDRVFSFAEAAAAHTYLESGKNVGKVVLTP